MHLPQLDLRYNETSPPALFPSSCIFFASLRSKRRRRRPISREVYQLIRDQVLAGKSMHAIADHLNVIQVRAGRPGSWTKTRVISAAFRLRKGAVPDVEPLPPIQSLTSHIRKLHEAGHSPAAIADLLNDQGLHTRSGTAFTADTVRATIVRLGFPSHFAEQEERLRALLQEWSPAFPPADVATRLNGLGLRTQPGTPWTPHNVCEKQVNLGIPSRRQRARKTLTTARPHRTEPAASQSDDVLGATD